MKKFYNLGAKSLNSQHDTAWTKQIFFLNCIDVNFVVSFKALSWLIHVCFSWSFRRFDGHAQPMDEEKENWNKVIRNSIQIFQKEKPEMNF